MSDKTYFRTIWISDLHLATRGCQAEAMLDFLRHHECETLYLVGDIIDGWRMKRAIYWPQEHNDVIQKILRKVRKGTQAFYLPGNHDESMRHFIGLYFGGVTVLDEVEHETADGKRLLVLHGDIFDGIVRHHKWLALLGERAHHGALVINEWLNRLRRRFGFSYWSLSHYLKTQVKNKVEAKDSFKQAVTFEARTRGFDGVVCGHMHEPAQQEIEGTLYLNTGDWVDHCTALAEHPDGRLELIYWRVTEEAREAGRRHERDMAAQKVATARTLERPAASEPVSLLARLFAPRWGHRRNP